MPHNAKEFFKLDPIDKDTLFWLMDNNPTEIRPWIDFIVKQYTNTKKQIDAEKLYEEVQYELNHTTS